MLKRIGLNKNKIFLCSFIILVLFLVAIGLSVFIKVEKQRIEVENQKMQDQLDEYEKSKEAKLASIDEKIRLRMIDAQIIIETTTNITKEIEAVKEEIEQIQNDYDKEGNDELYNLASAGDLGLSGQQLAAQMDQNQANQEQAVKNTAVIDEYFAKYEGEVGFGLDGSNLKSYQARQANKLKYENLNSDALMSLAQLVDDQKNIKINAKYDTLDQLNNKWDEYHVKYDVLNKEIEDLKAERLQYE